MNNTTIGLYLTSGSVYTTSGTIDLYDDVPISLNYSIADIREPAKRNADYSKTITVPGTNNNNKLFAHIYEIGTDRLYNPNHKIEARILYDNVQVMKGFMRLAKIRKLRDDKIEYDIEIRGRLDDLFTTIKDKLLTDLTWTDLNHTYNQTNIVNSWSAAAGSNYVYPFIDYGFKDPNALGVEDFRPAIYVKEIWDRIFSYAGFQYSSSFLTGDFFKRLIIPFTEANFNLTETIIQNREFRASRVTTDQQHTFTGTAYEYPTIQFNNDSTSPNKDAGGNYNTGTYKYTVPSNGTYIFSANISVAFVSSPGSMFILGWARIVHDDGSGGVAKAFSQKIFFTQAIPGVTEANNLPVNFSLFLLAGQTVWCDLEIRGSSGEVIEIKIDSSFQVQPSPKIGVGDSITFSSIVPQKLKMSDFLLAIIKIFNLYIEYDKDTPNKLYIIPRNDFYNSTIQDWSNKLDASQEPEIIPMGVLDAKRYIFKYKKDNDYLNQKYQDTYSQFNETYGTKIKDVDNDFLKNDNIYESIFSPSPLYSDTNEGRKFPAIVKVDEKTGVASSIDANLRLLYYGGLKSTTTWKIYDYETMGSLIGNTAKTQYPFCGHLDDPDAPDIDLSFGIPREVYYRPAWQATYTDNNIYNVYWKQFIDEITDKNSSIITAWFWLHPADIMQMDFRHVYRFLNQNFRLNKIYDYNPSELSLTKCEFIKLKAGIPFVKRTTILTGGTGTLGDGTPPILLPAPNPRGKKVIGTGNNVASTSKNVFILGNNNVVGEEADGVTIYNSSGCIVAGGLYNVSIYNSSGITVTEDNTIVENGVVISSPTYPSAFPSNYQSGILNPALLAGGGSALMAGLAGTISPSQSGKCFIIISGELISDTTVVNTNLNIRTGTGSAPANGDAVTGTLQLLESRVMLSATLRVPFALNVVVSLTRGTIYWVDMAAGNNGAGNVQLFNVSISIIEQ